MNRDDIKKILWLYRPGSLDAQDPEVMEALGLARQDPELSRWLETQSRKHQAVRQKMRQIPVPAGLPASIIREHHVQQRHDFWRQGGYLLAAAAMVALFIGLPVWLRAQRSPGTSFANYQTEMAAVALRGYAMELITNDPVEIRRYLKQNEAPADYILPRALQEAVMAGCAIESWQGSRAAMVCFRTGRTLSTGAQSDLWLFVIDQTKVAGAPGNSLPSIAKINMLTVATWNQGGKLYLLGTTAGEAELRKFL